MRHTKSHFTGSDFATASRALPLNDAPPEKRQSLYAVGKLLCMRDNHRPYQELRLILEFMNIRAPVERVLAAGQKKLLKEVGLYLSRGKDSAGKRPRRHRARVASDTDLRRFKTIEWMLGRLYQVISPVYEQALSDGHKLRGRHWERGARPPVTRHWVSKLIATLMNHWFFPIFEPNLFTLDQVRKRIE